ncbi:transporter substrate-binding domain-containing protein [Rudaeicoccus suwonensis]|uniref:Polar amino acid transport system substrate-binding protein n=1 Tax=Rudaeicoccus suwonensis TaxID=657409 RepID=A0A561E8G5_9MICO|nr:transporter substrate-binding domain-containing protein [Rudaeicoccus suwonensis]TWE11850.1 polar amino acid transport system substrate-binding protein [Rudaeicoccus suwonensis]
MSELSAAVIDELAPTGRLRASINLGNPVLAQGDPDHPRGVTVDLAAEIATRLGVECTFVCFDAARKSFEELTDGSADIGFLAIEPARARQVSFTAPYAVIEGIFVVTDASPVRTVDDADRPGVRIGVKEGSAYDLFLTRTLQHATIVRGAEGVDVFAAGGLEVGAGIRQPVTAFAEQHSDMRVVEPAFMQIEQAVAMPRDRSVVAIDFVRSIVEELKASGFVADALRRSGQTGAQVAPPA